MDLLRKAFGLREDQERLIIVPLLILLFLITLFALRGCLPNRDAGELTYRPVGTVLPAASAPVIKDVEVDNVQFAGSYLPNDQVSLYVNDSFLATVETDRIGRWEYTTTLPRGRRYNLRVTAQDADGGALESSTYPFIVRSIGSLDSDRSAVNYLPRIGESETLNGVPIEDPLFLAGLNGSAYSVGRVALAGTSTPGSQVIVTTSDRTLGRVRVDQSGSWELDGTFNEPGNYELQVRSVEAPNRPIDTINIQIARVLQAPTIEMLPNRPDPNVVNLLGTGEPNSDIELYSNGIFIGLVTTDADGNWAFDYTLPTGETNFEFVAISNAADVLEPAISTPTRLQRAVLPARVTLDPVSADFDAGVDLSTGNVLFSGTGRPVGTQVIVLVNDEPVGETTVDADGNWEIAAEISRAPGDYAVAALLGSNEDGLLATSETSVLTVPAGEPEPTTISLIDNGFDLDSATIGDDGAASGSLALTGQALPAGSEVVFFLDGDEVGRTNSADDGSYSFDYNYELAPGTYQLVSRVVDADGETAAQSDAFTIVIPEVEEEVGTLISLDADGFDIDAATIADDGTATGTLELSGDVQTAGSTVYVYLDDLQIGEFVSADGGAYTFPYDYELAPGSYELTTRIVDANGAAIAESETHTIVIPGVSSLRVVFAGIDDAETSDDGDDADDDDDADASVDDLAAGNLPAVELIVDASWSMTLDLSGQTRLTSADPNSRIAIAREAMNLLVDELPVGLPIAVRGFGNRAEPLDCQTDLEQPLQRLNREALRATLLGIEPQFDANTPIAESLREVAADLANYEGQKRVVLLTDGEENCNGDPAAEIQLLRDSGIDVTIDIVGFAIGDPALQAQFTEWAALGGGNYYNADNAEDLADALQEAIGVPYRVLDADGEEVATGAVGGAAINLPAGTYTVEVLTSPVQTFEIEIGDELTTLTID